MSKRTEEREIYHIPNNFFTTGRILGGAVRIRNAIEASILVLLTGLPVIQLPISLSMRIVILCLTTLPLGIFGVLGIEGESLSEFLLNWVKWLFKRRKLIRSDIQKRTRKKVRRPTEEIIPVKDIHNGVLELTDGRYIKILEVEPINFLLRSPREQRNIIQAFASWLKISPVSVQIKVLTKKADIGKHLDMIQRDMAREKDARCRELQRDYYELIKNIGSREAITRRFLIIFQFEPSLNNRKYEFSEIMTTLETASRTAQQYLIHCGNHVLTHEDENAFVLETLYEIYNRQTCEEYPLSERIKDLQINSVVSDEPISIAEILAPSEVDLKHGSYTIMDGVYHAYLMIPSTGYNAHVVAGWTSMLVNAGEGIDVDFYFHREEKDRIRRKLGQQLRINHSRIKENSDTNSVFDDIEGAIQSGYYLKQGLANYEDFYYVTTLVTVTASTLENLEWRVAEVKRLMASQDMELRPCWFRQEQAMSTVMPSCSVDKKIFEQSKRNMLTAAVSSFYPFTSYEMSDENGILLGVNHHNNSLVIVDIFNSRVYKNANMAILGTSGAGKTFTLQLMALRMRRKGTQVFIIAPLKGHEFYRACKNVGGEFISISPASKQCINIMEIRKLDQSVNAQIDGSVNDSSILARKIQQLHIFFSLLVPDITHEEKQLLDEALIVTYAQKGITHDNESLVDPDVPGQYRSMPLLEDVYNVLMENKKSRRIGNILNRLVHGSARTFNQHTNVDLSNPYTVLDISELTGDLLPVGMFLALDFVWDKAKEDRTKEKAIFIDETWQLVGTGSNAQAAEFCLEIFKIIRGYGGAAIAATQDINDFFALEAGKYGKGIINNAKTKIVLNLEDDEAQRVQEILKLTDAEVLRITRFERGSGLITTNNNHVTVQFKASPLEKQLITTDRYELSRFVQKSEE